MFLVLGSILGWLQMGLRSGPAAAGIAPKATNEWTLWVVAVSCVLHPTEEYFTGWFTFLWSLLGRLVFVVLRHLSPDAHRNIAFRDCRRLIAAECPKMACGLFELEQIFPYREKTLDNLKASYIHATQRCKATWRFPPTRVESSSFGCGKLGANCG
jgi:hypothetical protein